MANLHSRSRILYLTSNGLLEPLGKSQIWPYISSLSDRYAFSVISFEKHRDLIHPRLVSNALNEAITRNITWLLHAHRSKPHIIAPILSAFELFFVSFRQYLLPSTRPHLIHARSYVPAFVALLLNLIFGTPFIFDMRALWLEELILSRRLTRGSVLYRVLSTLQYCCLIRSAAVVSLTHKAVSYLRDLHPRSLAHQHFVVIPTCADLTRFQYSSRKSTPSSPIKIGCIGTVISGWFRLELLIKFFDVLASIDSSVNFEIITRDDPGHIQPLVDSSQFLSTRLCIKPADPHEVPHLLREHSASAMFFVGGLAKLGSSPTRIAEVLGSGIPVIINTSIGDTDEIIKTNSVGILLESFEHDDLAIAATNLLQLLRDPHLQARCRTTAEKHFSLSTGLIAYQTLYDKILDAHASPL